MINPSRLKDRTIEIFISDLGPKTTSARTMRGGPAEAAIPTCSFPKRRSSPYYWGVFVRRFGVIGVDFAVVLGVEGPVGGIENLWHHG